MSLVCCGLVVGPESGLRLSHHKRRTGWRQEMSAELKSAFQNTTLDMDKLPTRLQFGPIMRLGIFAHVVVRRVYLKPEGAKLWK